MRHLLNVYTYVQNRSETVLVKAGLVHDAQEFLLIHLPIPVSVRFIDHFLEDICVQESEAG